MTNLLNFRLELDGDLIWRLCLVLCAISLVIASADCAFAASTTNSNDVVGQTLCRLVSNLSGGIAKGIATIAIFAVGVGLFLGKLNWGIAAATAAGVGIIFSASNLVGFLAGSDVDATNCPTE
jgi:type IV secretory pathway VirB2 component (pilin)